MRKILLCGGGTAGHIIPNIALLDELKRHYDEISYIGMEKSMEENIAKKNGLKFYPIECVKLKRSLSIDNLLIPYKLSRSINLAKKTLLHIKPNVIFSKGGYVSLPVVIAAKSLKIPVVSHESDLTPGLANKISKNYSKCICTAFEECAKGFKDKGVYTKTPIRPQLLSGDRLKFMQNYGLNRLKKNILIMGGSSGAQAINSAVRDCLDSLLVDFNVIHLTGKGNMEPIDKSGYVQIEFTEDIADIFAATDYAVCRAGANSIFEMLALNKPVLLIPLPRGSGSRGDQIENAKYFKEKNLAHMLEQEDLTAQRLYHEIIKLTKYGSEIKQNIKKHNFSGGVDNVVSQILKYSN